MDKSIKTMECRTREVELYIIWPTLGPKPTRSHPCTVQGLSLSTTLWGPNPPSKKHSRILHYWKDSATEKSAISEVISLSKIYPKATIITEAKM